jgi:hypothetical protein
MPAATYNKSVSVTTAGKCITSSRNISSRKIFKRILASELTDDSELYKTHTVTQDSELYKTHTVTQDSELYKHIQLHRTQNSIKHIQLHRTQN